MHAVKLNTQKICHWLCVITAIFASSHAMCATGDAPTTGKVQQQSLTSTKGIATTPVSQLLPAGQATMRFLGFAIYDAKLWVHPAFEANDYGAHPLALQLTYQRDFTGRDIAKRSIQEMQGIGAFDNEQAQQWLIALQSALPDVKKGDSLLGLYQPGAGAVFSMGGKVVGEVADATFAKLFFGIWLSPQTSEPALRTALISIPKAATK